MSTTTDYQQKAIDFLNATSTAFTATYKDHCSYFNETVSRDVYTIVLKNKSHRYRFTFGQSIVNSNYGNTPPTAHDVFTCLQKYDCGTFENFCSDFGYDVDSRMAYKIYKSVLKEWKNVERLFNDEQLDALREIS